MTRFIQFIRGQPRWKTATVVVVLAVGAWLWLRDGRAVVNGTTFTARRGPLDINVLEGGSIEALESQEIRSEVKGMQGTKILKIVEEGYAVTEEDVKSGKVLVELDSSDLKQRILQQEILFQSTLAALTEAQQAYDIQFNQNKTDVKAAEQKAKFALMDFEKYMSEKVADEIISKLGMREQSPASAANSTAAEVPLLTPEEDKNGRIVIHSSHGGDAGEDADAKAPPTGGTKGDGGSTVASPPPATPPVPAPTVDFTRYAKAELLADGAAKQLLRKLEDDLLVGKTELGLALTKIDGTKRLFAKGFVTKSEVDSDVVNYDKAALKVRTAETALDLFIKYEFVKSAEEFLSKYDEALRALERARKEAVSKLAQAQAKLKAAEGRYKIDVALRDELQDQLEKCIIRAKKTGLVIYGGGGDDRYYGGSEQVREGATVRERQRIVTIPDMTQMAVKVKIHESHIKKVKRGLPARIQVDAFPDEKLTGEVTKVGVLPDSQNRWMNPDLKVYVTTVGITGAHDWVKPGMSAKVEIMVRQLPDVVHVPIQAVSLSQGKQICYVVTGRKAEEREVEAGDFNDEFIEIKSGLKEGEKVLLRAPEGSQQAGEEPEPTGEPRANGDKKAKPAAPPTAAPAAPAPRAPQPSSNRGPR